MDFVLSKSVYAYPYTINLTFYDTMVLIMKNYLSHQMPELGTCDCQCQTNISSWPDVVLLLAFLMCNFVVATTKLQSNNKNSKKQNNKMIEIFIIEQKIYVDWSFCSCSCCFSCIILVFWQQHNYTVTHFKCIILLLLLQYNYTVTTTTTTTKRSIYINGSIFNNYYLDWCFYFHCCCCDCVIMLSLLLFISHCASTVTDEQQQNCTITTARTKTTTTTTTTRSI